MNDAITVNGVFKATKEAFDAATAALNEFAGAIKINNTVTLPPNYVLSAGNWFWEQPFLGTADEYVALAASLGYDVTVVPTWRGLGTVLLELRCVDGSTPTVDEMLAFAEQIRLVTPVGTLVDVAAA